MTPEPTGWSLRAMVAAVRDGTISSVELVRAHAGRIDALNGSLNAIVVPDLERALDRAAEADRERATGALRAPLHGVPFTVKECIEVQGLELREGSKLRRSVRSRRDAAVVERLRTAGAIPIGKTNISELAYFPDSTNLVYGATRNPHDLDRSASGSSGGEAAAVASGMSAFGIGSDYGGSIRGPAHAAGVIGLRPGPGRVPLAGHAPEGFPPGRATWSTIGPLARTVDDLGLVLTVIADQTARNLPEAGDYPTRPVAVMPGSAERPLEPECRDALADAAAALGELGHVVVEASPPRLADAELMFGEVSTAETRYSIRSLLGAGGVGAERLLSPQLAWQWEAVRDLEPDLERYIEALALRFELEREVRAWMEEHPIVLAAVAATPANQLGSSGAEVAGRTISMLDLYASCTFASALSLPAIAIPVAWTDGGLPVAVQVIGRRGHEGQVLGVARELEEALGGWRPPQCLDWR